MGRRGYLYNYFVSTYFDQKNVCILFLDIGVNICLTKYLCFILLVFVIYPTLDIIKIFLSNYYVFDILHDLYLISLAYNPLIRRFTFATYKDVDLLAKNRNYDINHIVMLPSNIDDPYYLSELIDPYHPFFRYYLGVQQALFRLEI